MEFQVDYFDTNGLTGSDANLGSFVQAKELAESAVASGVAVRAEVRDPKGNVIFRRLRIVRNA